MRLAIFQSEPLLVRVMSDWDRRGPVSGNRLQHIMPEPQSVITWLHHKPTFAFFHWQTIVAQQREASGHEAGSKGRLARASRSHKSDGPFRSRNGTGMERQFALLVQEQGHDLVQEK